MGGPLHEGGTLNERIQYIFFSKLQDEIYKFIYSFNVTTFSITTISLLRHYFVILLMPYIVEEVQKRLAITLSLPWAN